MLLLQILLFNCFSCVYLLITRQIVALSSGNSRSFNPLYPSNFAFLSSYSSGRGSSPSPISRCCSTAGDVTRPAETNLIWEASDVVSDVEPQSSSSTELWLDLRGTAISPRVALHHLLKEPAESTDAAVEEDVLNLNTHKMKLNRVLVSHLNEEEFTKQSLTNVQMKPVQDMISDGFLVVRDDTEENTAASTDYCSLIQLVPTSYASQTYAGELITLKDAVNLVHPIPAMICLERGGWVVLDPSKIAEETDRMDSVTHIVNLLSGSLPSSLQLTTANKCESSWITSGETDNLGGRTSGGGGGIAIVCSSNQDVFNFAHLIESLRSQNDSSVTVQESGILTVSSSQKYQLQADVKVTTRLATALVLPFDLVLWETLSLFMQQSSI
jgi:hypothetical protein